MYNKIVNKNEAIVLILIKFTFVLTLSGWKSDDTDSTTLMSIINHAHQSVYKLLIKLHDFGASSISESQIILDTLSVKLLEFVLLSSDSN